MSLTSHTNQQKAIKNPVSCLAPGYVQGMSDLLAPLLFITQNEVESFWCLTGFMELVVRRHRISSSL